MCRVSPGSPTEAQLLLVTACTFWEPQSMGLAREGLEGLGGVRLSRVCVQGVPGQTLCPKDTPELSLQPPKEALPLWAQQEAGAARELQTQHVTADAA